MNSHYNSDFQIDVSIIIVNYNTLELTDKCIKSIIKYTNNLKYEIILVDNASTDGSVEYFKSIKEITCILAPKNLGFGQANNLGVNKAKGEFVFFLNSDTLLKENSIKKMIDFFRSNEKKLKIGALGCILIDAEGKINGFGNEFPTCKKEIEFYKSKLPILKYFTQNKFINNYSNKHVFFEIDYVIGADLMMKRNIFEKLKGFDKDYFMYYEESDLQKRMRKLNLKALIYTDTKIIHLEDGTGKTIKTYSNQKRKIIHTSKNIYLKKNDAANFKNYVLWDRLFLFLNRFNRNYTKKENKEYICELKKTHK